MLAQDLGHQSPRSVLGERRVESRVLRQRFDQGDCPLRVDEGEGRGDEALTVGIGIGGAEGDSACASTAAAAARS